MRTIDELTAHMREIAKGYPKIEDIVENIVKLNELLTESIAATDTAQASAKAWKSAALVQNQHALYAGNGLLRVRKLVEDMTINNYNRTRVQILEEIDKCLSQTVKHGSALSPENNSSH
jgi:hypothetical protein